jgi:hypothetical protein
MHRMARLYPWGMGCQGNRVRRAGSVLFVMSLGFVRCLVVTDYSGFSAIFGDGLSLLGAVGSGAWAP